MKFFTFLLCLLLSSVGYGAPCAFPAPAKVILSTGAADAPGSKLIQSWELTDGPELGSAQMPASLSLAEFQRTARGLVSDLSPLALLERAFALSPPLSPDRFNLGRAIHHVGTHIRPMQCLEALLLSQQTDRRDMARAPTEFTAFVLRSRSGPALKIFFYTVNQPGIGGIGEIAGYVERELSANPDWLLGMNLHNHNFFFDQAAILGVTSPSGADVGAFRNLATDLGLTEARITNGFDTLHLGIVDFGEYHASGE